MKTEPGEEGEFCDAHIFNMSTVCIKTVRLTSVKKSLDNVCRNGGGGGGGGRFRAVEESQR